LKTKETGEGTLFVVEGQKKGKSKGGVRLFRVEEKEQPVVRRFPQTLPARPSDVNIVK
jgi:hypothetical protein